MNEQATQPGREPRTSNGGRGFFYHAGIKWLAIVLCSILILSSVFSVVSVVLLAEFGFYTGTFAATQEEVYTRFGARMAEQALTDIYGERYADLSDGDESAAQTPIWFDNIEVYDAGITRELLAKHSKENVLLIITDSSEHVIASTYDGQEIQYQGETSVFVYEDASGRRVERFAQFIIPVEKRGSGLLYILDLWLAQVYDQRFALIVIGVLSCLLSVLLFVYLLCAAGRHMEQESVRLNVIDRLPFDVMLALYLVYLTLLLWLILNVIAQWAPILIVPCAMMVMITPPLLLLFCTSFSTRCKCGTLIKNTLTYRLLYWACRALRWFWLHAFCPLGRTLCSVVAGLPLVGKTALALFGISFVEFLLLLFVPTRLQLLLLWLIGQTVLSVIVLFCALLMRRLQKGGQALARGDLSYKIDEKGLPWDLRTHARDLNHISEGMSRAVEERMKSERFRTELITNVSHDIKTPLTTIISYINLLRQENIESETAQLYLNTLDRQSTRLKKLMEDLLEVSKASSGNMTVDYAPCKLEVLLSQALGEYEVRMQAAGLMPVLHMTSPSPVILADGRLLWRVFDNLLSNIVKYAMPGTRVYLDMSCTAADVTLTFRNISKEELNIPTDELLERFVRGDRSRHTEGSGLGLSIALSLTELMGGELTLEVDGDLFKASLRFDLYQEK